jgi:Uma2 family endonuclease
MVANFESPYLTPEEYLRWEEQQAVKYEYIHGEPYAMVGGTIFHNDIAINLTTALKSHLRGKGCKVQMVEVKLGVSQKGPFFYPDIMVTCDQRDKKESKIIYHPRVIIEVLSPSTEAFDRGDKFKFYRQIDTLKEYVLIDSKKVNIDCFRVNEKGVWELYSYQENDEFLLKAIDFSCPISVIYEDIDFSLIES